MDLELCEGKALNQVSFNEVYDHLMNIERDLIWCEPERLSIDNVGKRLFLKIFGKKDEYPLRKTFLYKLLKWYSFPLRQLQFIDVDTLRGILNDYLLSIKSSKVQVKIENGDALTILSENYTDLPDSVILDEIKHLPVKGVTRDDFFMVVRTEERNIIEPFPGDTFGVGLGIVNSETGFRTLSINNYLLRYICSNGAYVKSKEEFSNIVHYGKKEDEMKVILAAGINRMEVEYSLLPSRIKSMDQALTQSEYTKIRQRLNSIVGFSRVSGMIEDYHDNLSLYLIFNEITESAKGFDPYTQFRLEEFAGSFINMN